MTLAPDAAAVLARMATLGLPSTGAVSAAEMRALRRDRAPVPPPGPAMASVEGLAIPAAQGRSIEARLYRPTTGATRLIVYFHGGGWTFGSIDAIDAPARLMAEATGCSLLSVEYGLAPEHPFPAAIEDAMVAVRWAHHARERIAGSPDPVIVAGESAGANLSAVLAQVLADLPLLAQILVCPFVSADPSDLLSIGMEPPFLSPADVDWFLGQYLPKVGDRYDPRVSPARGSLAAALSPAYVAVAELDFLRDQGERYAAQLDAAGTPVTAKRYLDTFHGFAEIGCFTRAAAELRTDIAAFLTAIPAGSWAPWGSAG